jgi:hypothetical protein
VVVIAAALVGALPPLYDVDLAQHLATGEWIVASGTVPFTEPFAWTRDGQPYFAYSWLAQSLYFLLLHHFGPLALHVLQGATAGGAAAAMLWTARLLGCGPAARIGLAILHVGLLWGVGPAVRPQQLLFVALPLAWGLAARLRQEVRPSVLSLLAIAGVGAFSAGVHLFFPLTLVPVGYFLLVDARPARWLAPAAAVIAGWLVSPYALAWPRVFALNFGDNLLLRRPPPIIEFVPGFEYAAARPGVILAVLVLLTIPWLAREHERPVRERMVRALAWTAGLVFFAYAGRLVVVWWTLALPMIAAGAERSLAYGAALPARYRPRLAGLVLAVAAFSYATPEIRTIFWLYEGDTVHRMLPRAAADPALWLPAWLLCSTQPGAGGRIYTEFNYGSELTWRLPGYSVSIDGRTIFPASEAIEFTLVPHGRRTTHADTWRGADLVLVDRSFWVTPHLEADPDWVLLADGYRTATGRDGALWARRSWWERWGSDVPLPALEVRPGDPRGQCAAAGRFPW